MQWFRLYNELIDDPKIGALSDAEFRLWISIMCLASMANNGGDTKLTVSETEWKLRCNVSVTFQKLVDNGLVTVKKNENGNETIFVRNWKKRQYQSDTSTNRVRKFRNKNK